MKLSQQKASISYGGSVWLPHRVRNVHDTISAMCNGKGTMKLEKDSSRSHGADICPPTMQIAWGWGLAVLLLITVAFTSHELTQTQQQLEKTEREVASVRVAKTSSSTSHPDIAKIIDSLEQVKSASALRAEELKRVLSAINGRLEAALEKAEALEPESGNGSQIRGDLRMAQSKLDELVAKVDARMKQELPARQ